jgi:hypothetical protein
MTVPGRAESSLPGSKVKFERDLHLKKQLFEIVRIDEGRQIDTSEEQGLKKAARAANATNVRLTQWLKEWN